MNPNRTVFASSVVVLLLVACGGSSVAVGKTDTTDQQLQTKKDGSPTGDGATCSWADTALFDQVKASTPTANVPTYKLGDEFNSIDGCNECTCAAKGIMCTVKTCEPKGCTLEAKVCPDGSSVGRQGPRCEFAACPGETVCTDDAMKCPDGSYVGRSGPSCEFKCPGGVVCDSDAKLCPNGKTVGRTGPNCEFDCGDVACPADAKLCPDGSYVGRSGPTCEFVCPAASCGQLSTSANKAISDAIEAGRACEADGDCTEIHRASSCSDTCFVRMNKAKVGDVDLIKAQVNGNQCAEFKKLNCPLAIPGCAPFPAPPKCVEKKCQ